MSDNQTINALRRLSNRSDAADDEMNAFMQRQASGEKPDPAEFSAILTKRSVVHDAMEAQFKLNDKPLKTALSETH